MKKKKITNTSPLGKLLKSCKIEALPKSVQDSIPYVHIFNNGIIETRPCTFTIEFKLDDVNFQIATDEMQMEIFNQYMIFLNSFDKDTKWQILLQNHFISREDVLKKIRMAPQQDGLNVYRQEMNNIQIKLTATGKSSIEQSKYLVVSIEDISYENAKSRFEKIESNVNKYLGKLTGASTKRMETLDRLSHLYAIYNQDENVEPFIGNSEFFSFDNLAEEGLKTKDIIGPSSMDFKKSNQYMIGETYAKSYFIKKMPSTMKTNFLSDITDIPCSMLVSMKFEPSDPEDTLSAVRSQLASIEGQVSAKQKENAENGLDNFIPPELEKAYNHAKALMDDVLSSSQKLFFMSFTVTLFAESEEQLKINENQLFTVGSTHQTPIKPLKDQMESGFNSTLPLCIDENIDIDRQYTTENVSIFIPFTSQELNQDNAIFYGLNSTTENMILYDRLTGNNFNALIFGRSGTGKSFTTKIEMVSVLLNKRDAQVFVIDPQGEYYPLANNLHGKVIEISPTSSTHINPLDMDTNYDEDPIAAKTDFILGMLSVMVSNPDVVDNGRSSIDRCVRKIYARYLDALRGRGVTNDTNLAPTLADLYQELMKEAVDNGDYMAEQVANQMEMYVYGSYHTFAHRTNIDIRNERFVVYDIKNLGTGMKELGLQVCLNDVWNRMIENSVRRIYTYFYIDEFHLLLHNKKITDFLVMIWKMARKWLGCPCGIMQNTEDLLRDVSTRDILNNTSFIIMLSEEKMDRDNLQTLLHLSDAQLQYITNNDKGCGLIYTGKIILPFEFHFPKDTKLYALMTTSHDVEGAEFA